MMTSQQRWQRVKELFAEALHRAPDARPQFLKAACAGDPALLREVESLLAEHEAETGFMERPAVEAVAEQLVTDAADLAIGEQLGHFQIVALLGRGGMGEVYLAEDSRLNRKVALKLLPASFTGDTNRLRRFEQEARAASALNHPNILTIHEIGTENGAHYIATEYVEGETLREHISRSSLTLGESLDIATQVAAALTAAHQAGIVHRDIKPENIMLRRDSIVKVLDFGLAKLTEQSNKPSDGEAPTRPLVRTNPGVIMGTVAYMSPEQARGKEVDARTDIWSLGIVLYEMLAGKPPFAGETASDLIAAILRTEPPLENLPGEVPAEAQRILRKTLRKDKEERYQTSKDLLVDLKALKRDLDIRSELERSTPPQTTDRTPQDQPVTKMLPVAAATDAPTAASTFTAQSARSTSSVEYVVTEIRHHKYVALIALAAVMISAAVGLYLHFARSSKTAINSIAILPLVNVGADPNTEYLSDGISEGLINSLSQLSQLKVIARSSTFKYKGKEIDPQEVANALGVQAIVTGRIEQRGDNLQISVEMVDARDKTQVWGEQYNRKAADLLAVQEEMARTISEKLRLKLTGAQEQQLAKRATQNPAAAFAFALASFGSNMLYPAKIL